MKFLSFFTIYAKRTVRDRMFFIIMLLFPVLLIWLLGSAFAGVMGDQDTDSIVSARLIYTVEESSPLSEAFETHLAGAENKFFTLEKLDDRDLAMESIIRNNYDAFIIIAADKMTIYKNSYYNFNSSMAELILKTFTDDYNLMYEIASRNPAALAGAVDAVDAGPFTKEVSFDRQRTPGSMDYYGVTISTMFIFYGLIFLGTYFAGNKVNKTADRISTSPASMTLYQWGTAAGSVALISMQSLLVVTLGILVFKIYWGGELGISLLVILAEIIMVSAIGTILGIMLKNENMIAGISQIVIPAIVFLGDGYVQLGDSGALSVIKKLSPMYWINHGIFDAVYLHEYKTAAISISICLGIALLCTAAVALSGRGGRTGNA
ncbi:MAG: ABC transporter permease [Clostridia bacterium]|nr:ABC transporter permease [Clostridia bacterium]